jgi:hypothetical protein
VTLLKLKSKAFLARLNAGPYKVHDDTKHRKYSSKVDQNMVGNSAQLSSLFQERLEVPVNFCVVTSNCMIGSVKALKTLRNNLVSTKKKKAHL